MITPLPPKICPCITKSLESISEKEPVPSYFYLQKLCKSCLEVVNYVEKLSTDHRHFDHKDTDTSDYASGEVHIRKCTILFHTFTSNYYNW